MKETWKVLNSCIKSNNSCSLPSSFSINNKNVSNPNIIANGFNDFFVNIGPNLANNIIECSDQCFTDFMNFSTYNSMFLEPTNTEEINTIVNGFKAKTSYGHDCVDMIAVKKTIQYIAEPLTHIIFNNSITGIFPDTMKIAKVIPIFKSGDKQCFNNYRPASLLSQ